MDNHSEPNYDADGVLTDPSADAREWFRYYLYNDGAGDDYGNIKITCVSDMANLRGFHEMQRAFNSCDALTEIDLSGFDQLSLEDLAHTFGGYDSLTAI